MTASAQTDRRLADLLRRQHGAVHRRQALEILSVAALRSRLAAGRLVRVYPSVYVDVSTPGTVERRSLASVLACGDGAVLSHGWAATLHGVDIGLPDAPEVTVPARRFPRVRGVDVHRSARLPRSDRAVVRAIPVTSPSRTLVDVAGLLDVAALEVALDALWRRGSVRPEQLAAYLRLPWARTRPGSGLLRSLVAERAGARPSGSALETRYFALLRRYRVPPPVRQHPVRTAGGLRYIDFAYPDRRVAIELEGFEPRMADRRVFDDGMLRQNALEALGWTFRRFSWTHVTQQPLLVVVMTAEAAGLAPSGWRPAGSPPR